jgi:hypothetical protein
MTELRHDRAADAAAKDSPTGAASTLSSDVLDLLAAIRDAVDVPLPSIDPAAESAYHRLMFKRLGELHSSLKVSLSAKWADDFDPVAEAAYIRKRTAAAAVTYTLWERPADGGEQA